MRPARRSRRAGALAAAVALLLTVFAPAADADLSTASPAPPYLQGTGERFWASSNKAWSGARELTPDASSNPLSKPPGKADPDTVVWASRCTAAAQTVTFRRTLRLPGRPTKATFTIAPVFPFSVPTPFKTFKLALNGATVTQGKLTGTPYSGPSIVLGPKVLKRFTDGNNTVAVTVVRGPLPKKQKRCNTSSADLTGVVFRLFGDLDADLSLVDASVPTTKYYPAATQVHAVVNLSLTNKGPSGVIKGGIFKVRVGGISDLVNLSESTTQIPGTFPSAPPLDQCETTTVTPKPNLVVEIRCEMGAMPAGRVAHLSLGLEQTFASTEFHEATSTLQWTVSHPMDSSSDNQRGAQIVWCGTLSTKPECATG
ncbi:hypothetical protein [Nocardioides sp.]|uniref:hypothetical protein n=1 Tax=Nocardioides sp. TaxID=35761 RepID=UPI0037845E16